MAAKGTLHWLGIAAGVLFGVALLGTIAVGLLWPDRATVVGVAAPTLLVGMAFTQLHRFKRLKAPGFEAELRDLVSDVRAATAEATATLEQLRNVAFSTAKCALDSLGPSNIICSVSNSQKIAQRDEVLATLRAIGCTETQLVEASRFFNKVLFYQHAGKLCNPVIEAWSKKTDTPNGSPEYKSLRETLSGSLSGDILTSQQFLDFANEHGLMTDDIQDLIRDYEHYEHHQTLRRSEQWW